MPSTRKRTSRYQDDGLTQTHIAWLRGDDYDRDHHDWAVWNDLVRTEPLAEDDDDARQAERVESKVTGAMLWDQYRESIIAEHVRENPGSRPVRWWEFSAPERRRRIGGIGTPRHERLAYAPSFFCGVPDMWIWAEDLAMFKRAGSMLRIPAVALRDPPTFESEPAFLKRHGLLSPAERRQLRVGDYEPVSILDMFDFTD